jgi:urease accessory protein
VTTPGLAALLLLADGRLPSGAHAHSGGLEAAVAAGRVVDVETLRGFLRGRLATTGLVSAAFSAAACAACTAGTSCADPDPGPATASTVERLADLDLGLDARTLSPAQRRASRQQGRALMRAGRAMWRLPVAPTGRGPDGPHQAVALGAVAAAAGLSPAQAAAIACYGAVSGPAGAAVRLLGLDPYQVHAILADLAAETDRTAGLAATYARSPVDDLPAASAPLLDIGAESHASWEVRLFAS